MPFWINAEGCSMPCLTNLVLLQSTLNSNSPEVIPQSRSMVLSGVAGSSGQTVAFCHWSVWKTVGSCGEGLQRNLGWVGLEGLKAALAASSPTVYKHVLAPAGAPVPALHTRVVLQLYVVELGLIFLLVYNCEKESFKHTLGLCSWMFVLTLLPHSFKNTRKLNWLFEKLKKKKRES